MTDPIDIVIVGGGTAGWMTAAALAATVGKDYRVRLVESDQIGTVGVGEATLPQMKDFNDHIGILEAEMMARTQATFKLGIEFRDWGYPGSSYIHPFGEFGRPRGGVDFLQHWVRARQAGEAEPIEAYSYAVQACRHGRFDFPVEDKSEINSTYAYAYHLDAGLYAAYLREFAQARGVERTEGRIVGVDRHAESGLVEAVQLESGEKVSGDWFIDCSGFRSLLLGETLEVPFEDWSEWLPCDRAVAVPSERDDRPAPFTRSTALEAGWQWRIPLQHRTGNGHVFCSRYISDDEATARLLENLDSAALADPRVLRFQAGRRSRSWEGNCIAVGLSSGFLEPLESTSIYLVQVAIMALTRLFPRRRPEPALINEFNRLVDYEYDRVRDFLILHYHLNQRDDGELWRHCREMSVPDSLAEKMELFRRRGFIDRYRFGLFAPPSWISVFLGQGLSPAGHEPLADNTPLEDAIGRMRELQASIDSRVQVMPAHGEFVADYCPATKAALS
ncbi:tryptophan 7-halogenase [Marinihelvus fidelis]|uniref:Tryptophan 7-halogenase n=1 Tax=Marinihelvus fidelis TaxID=2613842 RepID=A0A5N0T7G8_9GAMM|nr:tryptophan halogenase family protein [Marinihelvus fidelis]KAA9130900.1 tryptophan 7-halogenase [Marinihelvus fidelis]